MVSNIFITIKGDYPQEKVAVIETYLMGIELISMSLWVLSRTKAVRFATVWLLHHVDNILYDIVIIPTFVVHALDCHIHQLEQFLFLQHDIILLPRP